MAQTYQDSELIPTEPEELKNYMAWKTAEARKSGKRRAPPKMRQGATTFNPIPDLRPEIRDVLLRDENDDPLLSLTEATIQMMDKDGDGWSEALHILYGDKE